MPKTINILVTAAGGPAGVNALKLLTKIKGVNLYGVDGDALSSGKFWTKEFKQVPFFNAPNNAYEKNLKSLIKKWNINIVLPTLAEELGTIEAMLEGTGVFVSVSPTEVCAICEDKIEFYGFLKQLVPDLVPAFTFEKSKGLPESTEYFIKPRFGRGSRGCRKVSKKELLALEKADCLKDTIIMENLPGMEWTVDAYFDAQGKEVYMVPRERLGFAGGISAKGRTVKNKKVIDVARKVFSLFDFKGAVFIQVKEAEDKSIKVVEINPRLSGGITITAAAGANPMQLLIDEYKGKTLTKVDFKEVKVVRYLEDIVVQ